MDPEMPLGINLSCVRSYIPSALYSVLSALILVVYQ